MGVLVMGRKGRGERGGFHITFLVHKRVRNWFTGHSSMPLSFRGLSAGRGLRKNTKEREQRKGNEEGEQRKGTEKREPKGTEKGKRRNGERGGI